MTVHANCHHGTQFALYVKACFLGKIKKNISICPLLKTLSRVIFVSVHLETRFILEYFVSAQRAHDVNTTSPQRRCNVMTLHRR